MLPATARARDVPPLAGRVNDRAGLLPPDARARIEQKLAAYEASSGHQFAVLTMPSLDDDALESFSIRVVAAWKLGRTGKDDGLLLLVVERPHAIRIEVGYGLEPVVTDALSAHVIREVMTPAFRAGDYPGGIERGLDRLMVLAAGDAAGAANEAPAAATATRPWSKWQKALLYLTLMFIGPLFLVILLAGIFMAFNRGGRLYRWGPSSGGGSGSSSGSESSRSGSSRDSSSSDSSSSGGFSGGGGGFGGGGASGSW